ncbi:MAG: hypothetical protein A2286_12170 [Gammaproteobacteria bacterium RIFOXYA12_FULL_61_12]|nr:MAG: hypothetical protein A2286_12170 [Gammaproteobacteria bacterium RIFOXYA12_FULL_61_12]OGT90969.1 MAG: hypothetical protein A2514_07625 [Gammaproteobacteria bacterium RIFOXYD12_FULL_61_37]
MKRYLVAGLLIWLPLGVTLMVVKLLVNWLDGVLLLMPEHYRPDQLLGFHIPGLGVVLSVLVVLLTGVLVANFFGRRLVAIWEKLLSRIPFVRSVYSASKQLAETMFSDSSQSFRKVVLVEWPRKGMWTLAFQTGLDVGEAQEKTGRQVVNLYVPTTPNPTGGYFVMAAREEVVELDMSVDEGLKMLLSMGAVVPAHKVAELAGDSVNP